MTDIEPGLDAAGVARDARAGAPPHFLGRLLRRPVAVVCLAYLVLITVVAIVATVVLPDVAREQAGDLLASRQGPSWSHPLGTDTLGRDVLERLLVGSRITLAGAAEALVVALGLGVPVGVTAGYFGGWVDRAVGWLADLAFSLPAIIITLVVLSVLPQNMTAAMVTLGVIAAPGIMRIVRSATLPVRQELYVAAAQVAGLSRTYIMTRHILPRIAGAVIVQASLLGAVALLFQTGLSFLGLVVAPPAPSWGGMVADGLSVIVLQPWLIWPPGVAIGLTTLALGLLGDAVRDATTERWNGPPPGRRRRPASVASTTPAAPSSGVTAGVGPVLLSVAGLSVDLRINDGEVPVLDGVSFDIGEGETIGLVGESGCGKTITAAAILGLLPTGGRVTRGRVDFAGRDLVTSSEREMSRIRGREIGFVSQEPMVSLNPAFRVGWQIAQAVRQHRGLSRADARERAVELLRLVRLPQPEQVARRYPHELSGGMAQRVAIARALGGDPRLLIADEPTTALDVTVQAEILDLLRELQRSRGMSILMVTHDWGVVADLCDRAVVMYAGQIVEEAALAPIIAHPLHPYTEALLASDPHGAPAAEVLPTIPGGVPQPGSWPAGCRFHPRCPYVTPQCRTAPIPFVQPAENRQTRCIRQQPVVAS